MSNKTKVLLDFENKQVNIETKDGLMDMSTSISFNYVKELYNKIVKLEGGDEKNKN
jgi:small nuclear ribonucleoprotein (snRNP)-like protein